MSMVRNHGLVSQGFEVEGSDRVGKGQGREGCV